MFVVDTGVLIWHLRGRKGYDALLDQLTDDAEVVISAMTRVEIIRGMRRAECAATYGFLDSFLTVPVDARIADMAGELALDSRERGVTMETADAVIAGTAARLGADLVTTNSRHFTHLDIVVWHIDHEGAGTRLGG